MKENQKLILAGETFYDEERELYYTYIGYDNKEKTLLLSVWGKTEVACMFNAEEILETLSNNV